MIGCTISPVSGAATHNAGRSSREAPTVWKMRLMFEFCRTKPIWMPKKPKLILARPPHPICGLRVSTGVAAVVAMSLVLVPYRLSSL